MPAAIKEKKPCPIDLNDWVHTHTIRDIPVMLVRPRSGDSNRRSTYWTQDGTPQYPIGPGGIISKFIPVASSDPEEAEDSLLSPPPSIPLDEAQELPLALYEALSETPKNTVLLHAEVARAVLTAAAFPVYGESIGHAQASRGESADLQGQLPDGSWKVRVCDPRLPGGFCFVRVPGEIEFELLEGDV